MKGKKIFLVFAAIAAAFFLISCGAGRGKGEGGRTSGFLYNGRLDGQMCVGGGYLYDQTKSPVQMRRLTDGAEYDFIRDPFFEENPDASPIRRIFPGKEFLYYYIDDFEAGSFQIVQRDYETFSEKTVYSKVYFKTQRELFLGAAKSMPDFSYNFLSFLAPVDFCVFEDVLFLFYSDRVECMDRKTKRMSLLCEKGIEAGNYAYYQGKLYFIGDDYSLYSYDIAGDKLEAFTGMKARRFLITPKGIFYANANDGWRLYFMDFNGEGRRKLTDTEAETMDFSGERLYYLSLKEDGGHIYSMALDGSDEQILFDLPESYALFYIKEEQTLYVSYMDSEGKISLYPYDISE